MGEAVSGELVPASWEAADAEVGEAVGFPARSTLPHARDSADARRRFLDHLAEPTGTITGAALAAGWSRRAAYRVRERDPAFAAAWDAAVEAGTDALERAAQERATVGWAEPVFYRGEVVGEVRKFSDRMLELLLKARRPEKYRERWEVTHTVAPMSAEELQAAREAGLAPEVEAAARTLAALPVPREEGASDG